MTEKIPVLVLFGPTASGKTKLAVEICKELNGEVVTADSMQVYKKLNIGTAKIKEEEKACIPHYLFDICEVEENYTVFDYQRDARKIIEENGLPTKSLEGVKSIII